MSEGSLVSDELRSLIGSTGPEVAVEVTRAVVHRAADVFRGSRAGLTLEPGSEVPGFVLAALEGDVPRVQVPEPLPRSLLVANEWRFERPLRLGEELRARSRVADIRERLGGRFGHSVYVQTEVEFREPASGALVAASSITLMYYDLERPGAEEDGE